MDQLKTKGQTALEYLLIVVVAIIVVVAVMAYMNASTGAGVTQGIENQNRVICGAQACITSTNCGSEAACTHFCALSTNTYPCTGANMRVNCLGVQAIGAETVPGHCVINATAVYKAS